MSQKAIIGVNGSTPFDQSVDKLRTVGIGAAQILWVPDAATRCVALSVNENGTYTAASAGKYGYDFVTVSVPGSSVTGIDPATGNTVNVGRDDDGNLVETVLPSEIRVTIQPLKLVYEDGETIDFSGIEVRAYDANGQELQVVPFGELVFPVTQASGEDGGMWTNGGGVNALQIVYREEENTVEWVKSGATQHETVYVGHAIGTHRDRPATYGSINGPATILVTRYNDKNYGVRLDGDDQENLFEYFNAELSDSGQTIRTGWFLSGGTSLHTDSDMFVPLVWEEYLIDIPESSADPAQIDITTMHGVQNVPVHWSRPGDGVVLTTSFEIMVELTGTGGGTP